MPIDDQRPRGSVVVTGASTGIGAACALQLSTLNYRVFAGVLRESEGEALRERAGDALVPVILDVTRTDHIEAAAKTVADHVGEAGLAGLVNNAGFAIGGPLEHIPIDVVRRQLEVNLIGQLAVTQAFLALLRQGRGRIVNIGSPSGTLVLPFLGPYAASKAGLKALTEALRLEMGLSGIPVSLVEPGRIATPLWEQSKNDTLALAESYPESAKDRYAAYLAAQIRVTYGGSASAPPPEKVAEVIVRALTSRRPKARYFVGADAKLMSLAAHLTPTRLRDWVIMRVLGRFAGK